MVRLGGNMRDFLNGHEDQTHVILDDIRSGSIDFETLLSITDGYRNGAAHKFPQRLSCSSL